MKLTLPAKVSLTVTAIIVAISAVSTTLFVSAHSRDAERSRLERGAALSFALAKSAEEGLRTEDLNLIKKASAIIQAPDVMLVQVFSTVWDPVDSYPFDQLQNSADPRAIVHFRQSTTPYTAAVAGGYEFYEPILYRQDETVTPFPIGYVRLSLSSAGIQQDIRRIVLLNIIIAAFITFIAVIAINILVSRLVVGPIMDLHHSVAAFRDGDRPLPAPRHPRGAEEIRDLTQEFSRLMGTVREREAQLIDSDRRIRSLFDRVEHAIFRTDDTGAIMETNGTFRNLFGDVGGLCDILIGERSAPDCLRTAAAANGLHLEDRAVGKGGTELFVSLSLYPTQDASGRIVGFDGYLIDITEKKRLEERLIRAQKLEAVGTLAGGMAHDFNNLLTAILGYSGILLKSLNEDSPLFKSASIIHNAAKRGAEFGKKILTITRKEKLETRPVQVNDLVNGALELLHRTMPKNIEIDVHLSPDLPVTNADAAQIQQVIINLAVNARDAMPDGGRLVLETSSVGAAERSGPAADSSAFIRLSVSDTGDGIDTETQARIFDPFFTTKEVGKGTGLGLYIVQSIVNKHGGYINLYSEPARGTRFNVYLPVTAAGAELPEQIPADLRGSETVLVIDDEPDVRELCRDILEPLGYTVLTADCGSAGIALYRERKSDVSLVVLDMVMPKMGGTEVFNALRTVNRSVKIILYSGYSNKNFAGIDELLRLGAVGFIQKPFNSRDLAVIVKKALSVSSCSPS